MSEGQRADCGPDRGPVQVSLLERRDQRALEQWRASDTYILATMRKQFDAYWRRERRIWVARHENAVAGTVQAAEETAAFDDLWPSALVIYIEALDVKRQYRRLGLGTSLMRAALQWATEIGAGVAALKVEPSNQAAMALYEELGFRARRESSWEWNGRKRRALTMGKMLRPGD